MTKPTIVTRAGKGSALTWTEGDTNLTNLRDATVTLKAGTGGTDVVSDLNGTVTLVAGSNITLSGDNSAKTITISTSGSLNTNLNYAQAGGGTKVTITTGASFPATIVSVSITTTGGPVLINAYGDAENTGAGYWGTLQLYRDTTALGAIVHHEGSSGSENSPFSLNYIDNPSAGTYTYYLKANSISGGNINYGESTAPTINVTELKGVKGDTGAAGADGTSGITDLVQDLSPQLGGDLDVNGKQITSASNGNITIVPNGSGNIQLTPATGKITLGSNDWPSGPGSTGQVLTTAGSSGTLSWTTITPGATSLDGLSDVSITSVATNDTLQYNGTNFVNTTAPAALANLLGFTTTATAAGTTTLTSSSTAYQTFTGFSSQTVVLPSVTTLTLGWTYFINNTSSGSVTVQASGGSAFSPAVSIPSNSSASFTVNSTSSGSSNTRWNINYYGNRNITGTGNLVYSTSPSLTTPNLGTPSAIVLTNASGTASININGTVGATTPSTGSFTTLTSTGAMTFSQPIEAVYNNGNSGAATITPNAANGSVQKYTLTGNITWNAFGTPVAGQSMTMILVQDATGGRTLTSTGIKWAGGSKTLSTAANATDIATVYYDGTNYYGSLAKGFA